MMKKSIVTNTLIGIIIIIAVITISSTISLRTSDHLQEMLESFHDTPFVISNAINSILEDVNEIHQIRWMQALDSEKPGQIDLSGQISLLDLEIKEKFSQLKQIYASKPAEIKNAESAYFLWQDFWRDNISQEDDLNSANTMEFYFNEYEKLSQLETMLKSCMANTFNAGSNEFLQKSNEMQRIRRNEWLMYVGLLLFFLIISFILQSRIVYRLREIAQVSSQLFAGKTGIDFDESKKDEVGHVCQNLNLMKNQFIERFSEQERQNKVISALMQVEQEKIKTFDKELAHRGKVIDGLFNSDLIGIVFFDKSGNLLKVNDYPAVSVKLDNKITRWKFAIKYSMEVY
ncbi:MAG: hypothetical protein K9M99_12185 [Candidatus Cloacimonetes bacterium]|nr:hypothetical protein [Candidatus Cloacimonadota bacterium]